MRTVNCTVVNLVVLRMEFALNHLVCPYLLTRASLFECFAVIYVHSRQNIRNQTLLSVSIIIAACVC